MALAGIQPLLVLGSAAAIIGVAAVVYRPVFGLAVLAFTSPFDLTTWAGPVKLTTSAALMGVMAVAWIVRQLWSERFEWRHTRLDVAVLLFMAATLLSLAGLGGNLQDQLVGLLKAGGGFLMFFLATQALRSRSDVWLVVAAIAATGLIQVSGLAIGVLTGSQTISTDTRATGTVIDPNLFAGYLVLIAPLVVAVGLALKPRWSVVPTTIALLAICLALLATLSRSGWLGLLTGLLVLAVLLPRRRWQILGGAAVIAIVLVAAGLATDIGTRLSGDTANSPANMLADRAGVWAAAIGIFLNHPLFGVGVANFVNYYPEYSGNPYGLNHAHNIFLNMAAERGIVGLAAFGYFLVILFKGLFDTFVRARPERDRVLLAALAASFAGFLAHSMLDVSYYDYKILLLFWLLGGIAATLPRALQGSAPKTELIVMRESPSAVP